MGVLYILLSGASFGLLPWFSRIASGHGASPLGTLAARFSITAVVMIVVRLVAERRKPWPRRDVFVKLFLLGAAGYAVQSAFYLSGVDRIDVSLATVIFYTFPVMVVLASWAIFKQRPTRVMVMCLAITVVGAVLTAGQVSGGSTLGVAYMVMAGAWYTGYILVSSKIVQHAGALTSLTIVMLGSTFSYAVVMLTVHPDLPQDGKGWLAAAGAAVVSTVFGMGFFFAGVQRLPPGEAAVLSTIEPVVSIFMGVVALGESLNAVRVVGAVLVLFGVTLLARSRESRGLATENASA